MSVRWARLASPTVVAAIGFAPALVAFLYPAQSYERVLQEHDYVAGNVRFLFLAALCFAAVLLGSVTRFQRGGAKSDLPLRCYQLATVIGPLGGAFFLLVAGLVAVSVGPAAVLGAVAGEQSSTTLRFAYGARLEELNLGFAVNLFRMAAPILVVAGLVPSRDAGHRLGRGLYWAGLGALIWLSQSRELFFFALVCAGIAIAVGKQHGLRLGRTRVAALLAVLVAFAGFAVAVQSSRFESVASASPQETVLGYTVASFNRAAAIMDGALRIPDAWNGYYWTRLAWEVPVLGPVAERATFAFFGGTRPPVSSLELAPHLELAGLRARYNVLSGLGQSWLDFRSWSVVPFLLVGAAMGRTWARAAQGSASALVVYCALAFATLDLIGHLRFSDQTVLAALLLAVLVRPRPFQAIVAPQPEPAP